LEVPPQKDAGSLQRPVAHTDSYKTEATLLISPLSLGSRLCELTDAEAIRRLIPKNLRKDALGAMAVKMIRSENLVKSYRRHRVVNNVSVEVNEGEVVGLLGPNGAGKTTTFYMIVGLVHPESGTVHLNGRDVTRSPMHRRARWGIGYLSQEPSIFRKLSVEQNIRAILQMSGLPRKVQREKMESLVKYLDIEGIRRQKAYTLSGGERRRTEIARTLAIAPSFILLDEPFTGVDPIAVEEIKSIILQLKKEGIGVLITDHSVRDTLEITDRAYIIHSGTILTSGSSADLPNDPIARKFYLGDRFSM